MPTAEDLGDTVALQLEGLALSESSMRCSILWAGDEFPCVGGPEFGGKSIVAGGFRVHAKLKIKVRTEVFPGGIGLPQEKQIVEYKRNASADPKRYRIAAVTNFYGAFLELECEDPNEGA